MKIRTNKDLEIYVGRYLKITKKIKNIEMIKSSYEDKIRNKYNKEIFDSLEEYNEYYKNFITEKEYIISLNNDYQRLKPLIHNIRKSILESIPKNVWIKVNVLNKTYGVGIETSNWGGYKSELYIEEWNNENMRNIKHKIYD